MAGTRSSTRKATESESSPTSGNAPVVGRSGKRKTSSPGSKSKRSKKGSQKEQITIEASMPCEAENRGTEDVAVADVPEQIHPGDTSNEANPAVKASRDATFNDSASQGAQNETDRHIKEDKDLPKEDGFDKLMNHSKESHQDFTNFTEAGSGSKVPSSDNAVEESVERAKATPPSILEKGIIYFFFRSRVGIDEPSNVNEIARSYIVLRPLPHGAKLGAGPIGDASNNRMLSLPKKVLPASPKDRFLTFVEKSNSSLDDIKAQLSSSDYATKTAGVRHTPAAAPIGEGVYAITKSGRETHLAYILTIPSQLSNVQKDVGLRQRGSYITSAKNPKSSSPANASLPRGAEYPQEIIDEFHGRGWMPLQPRLLDYIDTQFLLIGHGSDALEKATKAQDEETEGSGQEAPLKEMETLEDEDETRTKGLDEDDAVFTDLGLSSKEFPKVQTTWS